MLQAAHLQRAVPGRVRLPRESTLLRTLRHIDVTRLEDAVAQLTQPHTPPDYAPRQIVTGSSSNPALVPDANIVFGGSGANRTVTITPAANQNGSATIIVTASDGTDSGSTIFMLTVTSINDTPTATFGGGGSVDEGASATVSFSNETDADPADVAAGLRYSYDFDNDGTWDSGDGSYAGGVSNNTAAVPAALLADGPAAFTTRARISDQNDAYTEYTTDFTVANLEPLANAGGPYSGVVGSPYGAVRESDELDGATYNNIRSITVTEAMKLPAVTVLEAASATALPARSQ